MSNWSFAYSDPFVGKFETEKYSVFSKIISEVFQVATDQTETNLSTEINVSLSFLRCLMFTHTNQFA